MTFVNLKLTTVRDVSKVVISVVLHLNKAKGAFHKQRRQLGGGKGVKNCSKLPMDSTKKNCRHGGGGVKLSGKKCRHRLWMVPKTMMILQNCNMAPPLGGPLTWDVNIYFFIFLCLHYSQSPTSYRHIQKAPFCVQFDILLAWKKIGKEIFCFIGMQLRIRRKKKVGS